MKKYKRIGWIVEWLPSKSKKWTQMSGAIKAWESKSEAIGQFNEHCKFWYIPTKQIEAKMAYRWLKRRDLARCVPVYVEDTQ